MFTFLISFALLKSVSSIGKIDIGISIFFAIWCLQFQIAIYLDTTVVNMDSSTNALVMITLLKN